MKAIASTPLAKNVCTVQYDHTLELGFRYSDDPYTRDAPPCTILSKVAQTFHQVGSNLTELLARQLRFEFFTSIAHVDALTNASVNIKTVYFEFHVPLTHHPLREDMKLAEDNLRAFLHRLQHLENLCLVFHLTGVVTHQHRLCDLIPITHKWPRLRDLTLHAIYCTVSDLVAVMDDHADSLVNLNVTRSQLDDPVVIGADSSESDRSRRDKAKDWRKIFEQVGRMNLEQGYISESRDWPPTAYDEVEEGLWGWTVDCEDGKQVTIDTNLDRYLEDDYEGDMNYDSSSKEDVDYGDEGESDDSEFWSDDGEYWEDDNEFFARDSEILPDTADADDADDADDTDDSEGEMEVHEA